MFPRSVVLDATQTLTQLLKWLMTTKESEEHHLCCRKCQSSLVPVCLHMRRARTQSRTSASLPGPGAMQRAGKWVDREDESGAESLARPLILGRGGGWVLDSTAGWLDSASSSSRSNSSTDWQAALHAHSREREAGLQSRGLACGRDLNKKQGGDTEQVCSVRLRGGGGGGGGEACARPQLPLGHLVWTTTVGSRL